jgi:DNA-binding transcriptional MocR family regulator
MILLTQCIERGAGAATIAARIEAAIAGGSLAPAARLPTVRELAAEIEVSPATVAAAYRMLKQRGLVSANSRRGTVVTPQPPLRVRGARPLPRGARDLASGNPDPALLPPLGPALARLDPGHKLYGGPVNLARLVELAEAGFAADGIAGDVAVVGGALDGIERVLQTQLRPGDRVAVEDPTWPRITDLVHALGLQPEPVRVDRRGPVPGELARALDRGARAVIVTPRGQNPTGAAVDAERGSLLRELLGRYPDAVVIEDDYVAAVAGAPYVSVHEASARWVVIRSLSKVLGPDLRVAPMAGDALTISRVEGRQLLGAGWVSHLLQQTAALLWASPATRKLLARAERAYAERRSALIEALAGYGIAAYGSSGLGVWVPVAEEVDTVQQLLDRGWAVSPGEHYRFRAPAGIRITTAGLESAEAAALAAAMNDVMRDTTATYSGLAGWRWRARGPGVLGAAIVNAACWPRSRVDSRPDETRRHPARRLDRPADSQLSNEQADPVVGYHAASLAGVAQLAEQPSCKRQASGSNPLTGSQVSDGAQASRTPLRRRGGARCNPSRGPAARSVFRQRSVADNSSHLYTALRG